jgi:hypothetical protein
MSEVPTVPCPVCGSPAVESNCMIFCGKCRKWHVKPKEKAE